MNTHDLTFAIRDMLEGNEFSCYGTDEHGDWEVTRDGFTIESVDVSDIHNPIVEVAEYNGGKNEYRRFKLIIVAV